jgi:hypothetical protein
VSQIAAALASGVRHARGTAFGATVDASGDGYPHERIEMPNPQGGQGGQSGQGGKGGQSGQGQGNKPMQPIQPGQGGQAGRGGQAGGMGGGQKGGGNR